MNKSKLDENSTIKEFRQILEPLGFGNELVLIGGAVIDILEDRVPKDFDFMIPDKKVIQKLEEVGFVYQYETKSSLTYKRENIIIQFISTPLENFDFKISQANYLIKSMELEICEISFKNKILIPVDFESKRNAFNSLRRIPHWMKKGYKMREMTYLSLLNVASKKSRNLES